MGHIQVHGLGKAYRQYKHRWSRLAEWLLPGKAVRHQLKWILQDINFEVQAGEAVGIIGINGAGKSTLLKLITGTTQPTTGTVSMTGRVAAMLELGMGFHPDFTGRQNAHMAAQLIGISVEDITRLMPHIEAFAELGHYIDQPVRVYSSGMQMRLAFSVATAVRPDILIVDEALSVGDTYFQHKSFDRIRAFRELGTTLLIVSHDKGAIQSICDRAILLNEGRIALEGTPETVMDFYNAMLAPMGQKNVRLITLENNVVQTRSGTGEATLSSVHLLSLQGLQVENVAVGQKLSLVIQVKTHQPIADLVLGFMIKDRTGQAVFGTNTHHLKHTLRNLHADQTLKFIFDFNANLGPGSYSIAVALHDQDTHLHRNFEWRDLAVVFQVVNTDKSEFVGCNWLPVAVRIE
ncbi:ABC transporter ATP-binding protein [Limnohabitans sp. Rim8]|uniref:ABC transporter ATP-binding protein n=1 Tax=Limnohabitans sp. Rim8 TaxID=1100718 RepID=UPI0025CE900C|nr:ABC transporter ATP-binding protein [Limnohabitans sp. Rim8]